MASSTTGRDRKKSPRKAAASKSPARKKAGPRPSSARQTSPDVEIDGDVLEFIEALDRFRKEHNKTFPSWSEVLHVLRSLGYSK